MRRPLFMVCKNLFIEFFIRFVTIYLNDGICKFSKWTPFVLQVYLFGGMHFGTLNRKFSVIAADRLNSFRILLDGFLTIWQK